MATYFHLALSGPTRTWLMNQALGSIYSWEELCAQFMANFANAYQQHGVEAHLHAVRGCATRRCWKSWSHVMWTTSPHSSLWLKNVPGPPRAVLGTWCHKLGSPRRAVRVPSPRAMAKRKRETRAAAARSSRLLLQSSLQRLGAGVSAASAHGPRKATTTHAQYTPTAATASLTAERLSNS